MEQYEIHVLYSHTLSKTGDSVESLRARGLTVMSVHELAKNGVYTFDKQISLLMREHAYKSIYFHSIYSAKYYVPFLILSPVNARTIIDGGKARYVDEKIRASDQKISILAQSIAKKNYRIARLAEIAIYRHADVIIVPDAACRDILKNDLPDKEIRVISDMRSDKDAGQISREAREAFALAASSISAVRPSIPDPIILETKGCNIITAYNDALHRMDGRYGIIVTPETMIDTFTVERMTFCADSDPEIGLVSPVSNITLAQPVSKQDVAEFLPRHFAANIGQWHESKHIVEPSFLVRREVLKKIGYFDDHYQTLYYALHDFGMKLFQAGYYHVVTNEAFVYYTERHSDQTGLLLEDKKIFMRKWASIGTIFLEKISSKAHVSSASTPVHDAGKKTTVDPD